VQHEHARCPNCKFRFFRAEESTRFCCGECQWSYVFARQDAQRVDERGS
jgi:ribosomal protein S27AE